MKQRLVLLSCIIASLLFCADGFAFSTDSVPLHLKLTGLTTQKGFTLTVLSVYLKRGRVKLELGLARGKKLYDKRQDLKEKAVKKDIERRLKDNP